MPHRATDIRGFGRGIPWHLHTCAREAPAFSTVRREAMAIPDEREIQSFLTQHLQYWNAGQRTEMNALYRRYAQDQLIIEYVGQPTGDGWKTYEHMWDTYGGKVRTDAILVLVNGNEAACHYNNVRVATGIGNASIEVYRFEERRLHIRYFHKALASG
jgi:hypothetical protein